MFAFLHALVLLAAISSCADAIPASLFSGWLVNTTYASNDCTGTDINSYMFRSFDSCFASDASHTSGVRQYCTADTATGSWSAYNQPYTDPLCTSKSTIAAKKIASGPACDARGNSVRCQSTLAGMPASLPRAFVESVYTSLDCTESAIYQRIIAPPGGCVLITVDRTDAAAGVTIAGTAYFKVASCEVLSSGMVAFGSLYANDKCTGQGVSTSHMLPRGCIPDPAGVFSFSFTCG